MKELWILGGITAAGKSELAVKWALAHGAEILSCDSVSFYRGLDVGSAKPDLTERALVPHHGLDLADPHEVFDVAKFHAYARGVLEEIFDKGKRVIVVGGSGFFLEGFLNPIFDETVVSPKIRDQVRKLLEREGLKSVLKELQKLNPQGLGSLDVQNPIRLSRALERSWQSGKSLVEQERVFRALPPPYADASKKLLWLDRKNGDLEERINSRTRRMIERGLIEETRLARERGLENHLSLAQSVGYREALEYLNGGMEVEELVASIISSTRKLVSKQRKWFRKRFPEEARFELSEEPKNWIQEAPWVSVA